MINYFRQKMDECATIVQPHIVGGTPDPTLDAILRINYAAPTATAYNYSDPLCNAVYLLKYGYAYAYEYSVLYSIVLNDYLRNGDPFGVTCCGCGSGIDAWSLAYANSRQTNPLSLRYVGTDLEEWGIQFKPEPGNEMETAYTHSSGYVGMRYPGCSTSGMKRDILEFFRNEKWQYSYNTILFSKILNELPDTVLDDLVDYFRTNAGEFAGVRTKYICISHSVTQYNTNPAMKKIAQKICEAINTTGCYTIDDTLPDSCPVLVDVSDPADYNCYKFADKSAAEPYPERVGVLNTDFAETGAAATVRSAIDTFIQSTGNAIHRWPTRPTTSLIQIIKLSPVTSP